MVTDRREEMLELNTVRCIAILLTTECESAGILKPNPHRDVPSEKELRKSQEELIIGILKCLGYFTTHATTQCGEQVILFNTNRSSDQKVRKINIERNTNVENFPV